MNISCSSGIHMHTSTITNLVFLLTNYENISKHMSIFLNSSLCDYISMHQISEFWWQQFILWLTCHWSVDIRSLLMAIISTLLLVSTATFYYNICTYVCMFVCTHNTDIHTCTYKLVNCSHRTDTFIDITNQTDITS